MWEIAIKLNLGKLDITGIDCVELYKSLIASGFCELSILSKHCFVLEKLPSIHKDPFDRLLIAQAMAEEWVLITHDDTILQYQGLKTLKA